MSERLGKMEMARILAQKTGKSIQDSGEFIDAFVDVVRETIISGGQITLKSFGVFSAADTKGRNGVNPKTGEMIKIEASRRPRFAPARVFKEDVKQAQ